MLNVPVSRLLPVLVLAAAAALAGCAHSARTLDSPESSTDNFQKAKAAGIRPVAVGEFTSERDSRPTEARFLKDTLATDLQSAGLLDPAANAVVQGHLVAADLGGSRGSVAARFIVTMAGGRVVYDRELRASASWGAGAKVAKEQSGVYRKLIGQLFSDPAFKNALAR